MNLLEEIDIVRCSAKENQVQHNIGPRMEIARGLVQATSKYPYFLSAEQVFPKLFAHNESL